MLRHQGRKTEDADADDDPDQHHRRIHDRKAGRRARHCRVRCVAHRSGSRVRRGAFRKKGKAWPFRARRDRRKRMELADERVGNGVIGALG
ncbi:hypothetical protein D9M68_719240 [compost metagenome]